MELSVDSDEIKEENFSHKSAFVHCMHMLCVYCALAYLTWLGTHSLTHCAFTRAFHWVLVCLASRRLSIMHGRACTSLALTWPWHFQQCAPTPWPCSTRTSLLPHTHVPTYLPHASPCTIAYTRH